MKNITLLTLILLSLSLSAQLKVGRNAKIINSNAIFEMESDTSGMLLPRVNLLSVSNPSPLKAHVKGMHVYNLTSTTPRTDTSLLEGEYYNDGSKWIRLHTTFPNNLFFYMPSITINTSSAQVNQSIDLYQLYRNQFQNPAYKNPSAPSSIDYFVSASSLNYFISSYDSSVIRINSLSDQGVLNYDVINPATECSLLNIIFQVK